MTNLKMLLSNLDDIRELRLHLSDQDPVDPDWIGNGKVDRCHHAFLYAFTDIFPLNKTFSRLKKLDLSGMEVQGPLLYNFLTRHLPTLKTLALQSIDLLSGSWESLFVWLRHWQRFGPLPRLMRFGIGNLLLASRRLMVYGTCETRK